MYHHLSNSLLERQRTHPFLCTSIFGSRGTWTASLSTAIVCGRVVNVWKIFIKAKLSDVITTLTFCLLSTLEATERFCYAVQPSTCRNTGTARSLFNRLRCCYIYRMLTKQRWGNVQLSEQTYVCTYQIWNYWLLWKLGIFARLPEWLRTGLHCTLLTYARPRNT